MNIVLSICAVVVTIIIACLAYSVIRMLKHVKCTLGIANSTLEEAKTTIHDLRAEAEQISQTTNKMIQDTNAVTLDVQKKMKDLDIWFGTVKEVGAVVHSLTTSFRQSALGAVKGKAARKQDEQQATQQAARQTERQATQQAARQVNTISAIADGVVSSIRLWNRLKQSNKSIQ